MALPGCKGLTREHWHGGGGEEKANGSVSTKASNSMPLNAIAIGLNDLRELGLE